MYSTKEKLSHFRTLLAPDLADADLHLLKEKDPENSNLIRFTLAPAKNVEDILFALLDVCTHDEIVRNRRDFAKPSDPQKPKRVKKAVGSKKCSGKRKTSKKAPDIHNPRIDWANLDDKDVQMATVIYNDRINTYHKMKQLDEVLEKKPTPAAIAEMAEVRIRNLQAFAELQSFNDNGKFLCKHPILYGRSEIAQLIRLLKADPAEFLRQHKNVLDNIKRYRAYLKRKDRTDKRSQDKQNLERHQDKERLFRLVLEQK